MTFAIAPSMLEYLQDLAQFGVAYHCDMDHLDFVARDNLEARGHAFVTLYSPCTSLEVLRAFYSEDIVGVRFITLASLTRRFGSRFGSLTCAQDALDRSAAWLAMWNERKESRMSPAEYREYSRRAERIHAKARAFILQHPESCSIPEPVLAKVNEALKRNPPPRALH